MNKAVRWEFFITGDLSGESAPAVTWCQRITAAIATVRALRLLRAHGLRAATDYIERLPVTECGTGRLSASESVLVAHRELPLCWVVGRLVEPRMLCLQRSVALVAYVRSLGLPAQIVIGRARLRSHWHFDFHAWTELYQAVIDDDDIGQMHAGYAVLQRVPKVWRQSDD